MKQSAEDFSLFYRLIADRVVVLSGSYVDDPIFGALYETKVGDDTYSAPNNGIYP